MMKLPAQYSAARRALAAMVDPKQIKNFAQAMAVESMRIKPKTLLERKNGRCIVMKTYFLSFADEEKFCGACIIDIDDDAARLPLDPADRLELLRKAIERSIELGCNGGADTSVQGENITGEPIPAQFKNQGS